MKIVLIYKTFFPQLDFHLGNKHIMQLRPISWQSRQFCSTATSSRELCASFLPSISLNTFYAENSHARANNVLSTTQGRKHLVNSWSIFSSLALSMSSMGITNTVVYTAKLFQCVLVSVNVFITTHIMFKHLAKEAVFLIQFWRVLHKSFYYSSILHFHSFKILYGSRRVSLVACGITLYFLVSSTCYRQDSAFFTHQSSRHSGSRSVAPLLYYLRFLARSPSFLSQRSNRPVLCQRRLHSYMWDCLKKSGSQRRASEAAGSILAVCEKQLWMSDIVCEEPRRHSTNLQHGGSYVFIKTLTILFLLWNIRSSKQKNIPKIYVTYRFTQATAISGKQLRKIIHVQYVCNFFPARYQYVFLSDLFSLKAGIALQSNDI